MMRSEPAAEINKTSKFKMMPATATAMNAIIYSSAISIYRSTCVLVCAWDEQIEILQKNSRYVHARTRNCETH